ncbi:MAG: VOC family protein [archaeon]
MNMINWIELPVRDMSRAKTFYETVLGVALTVQEMDGWRMATFPFEKDQPGTSGGLIESKGYIPTREGPVIYFTVPNIDTVLEKVTQYGGRVVLPKRDIGEHGFMAHVVDTEGNRVGLHMFKR